ncbi:MAG: glycerol dehydrogenase [Sphingobacteriia bacterium]|nr:glycerol dehydrogenase [Sphingobacteriia bacterium]
MLKKTFFPGRYIQGPSALEQLPQLILNKGKQGLVLASASARRILSEKGGLAELPDVWIESFSGECCEKELHRLAEILKKKQTDVLVGMGGGKAIDTAKIAADRAGIPVLIVPTIASTDAPCSGCAVVYSEDGIFESVHYQKSSPAAVLVDTEIIVKAPSRFLVAGMGDALATWFEARSCHQTRSPNVCGGLATQAGIAIAKLCHDILRQYGPMAKISAEKELLTPALEHVVEANILLSGIGFESGGLACAHAIHNGLTALEETHAFYHGEKVAFGVLTGLILTDAPPEETQGVFAFCEEMGLPTTLGDLGLVRCDRTRLMQAAEKACAPEESIHNEAGRITPEGVLNAMLAASAMGERRRNIVH